MLIQKKNLGLLTYWMESPTAPPPTTMGLKAYLRNAARGQWDRIPSHNLDPPTGDKLFNEISGILSATNPKINYFLIKIT